LASEGDIKPFDCPSNLQVDEQSAAIPSAPSYLAAGGHEPPTAPGLEPLPNPGALVCPDDGKLLSSWRYYEFAALPSGFAPSLNIIHRFQDRPFYQIGTSDILSVISLAGHDVINVDEQQILIPTDDGFVEFQNIGLPFEEVMHMAASYLGGGPSPIPSGQ
jgi:hypothetical protein